MMEITEDFLKLIQIAFIVTGVLAIFFTYIQYNIFVSQDRAEREAVILGNSLLSDDCLTYSNTRGLFSEEKIENANPSCFNYPYGSVTIELLEDIGIEPWNFEVGEDVKLHGESEIFVAVKLKTTGEIKAAKMMVEV